MEVETMSGYKLTVVEDGRDHMSGVWNIWCNDDCIASLNLDQALKLIEALKEAVGE